MAKRIESGSKVVVKLTNEFPAPGIIGAFQTPDNRMFVKVFRRNSQDLPELHSINGAFPVITAPELKEWNVRAIAKAIIHPYSGSGSH